MKFKFYYNINSRLIILFSFIFGSLTLAQHRGDNLAYQGVFNPNENGIKALAMGGAYTSISGDINSLFWNPAGLASIDKFQVTVSANYYKKMWRENQEYRPNRYFVTLPFYLEGLYIPDPKNNGVWDYELARDTNYYVSPPVMGADKFSEEAADWQNNKSGFKLTSAAVALPFRLSDYNFVVSLGYNQNRILDFDRNDTFLNPDLGYTYYNGDIGRVSGADTLNVKWSKFLRSRFGTIHNIQGAVAFKLNEFLQFGIKSKIIWGKTDDSQYLIRVGSFDLADQNRFRFSYQNVESYTVGNSNFSGTNFTIGALLSLNRFQIGANINLPYTLERQWNYSTNKTDSTGAFGNRSGAVDKFIVPLSYSLGASFKPVDEFIISFDYEFNPYSKAEFKPAESDSTFRTLANQKLIRIGLEYKPFDFLSLLAGYRNIPQTFVPDGAAINDAGPEAVSYTFGASVNILYGRIDIAYEIRNLKYYDSYYSNTNYNLITYNNLMFGYTFNFN